MIEIMARIIRAVAIMTAMGAAAPAMASYVNSNGVNCRAQPDTGAKVVAKLSKGQPVSVVEGGGGWSRLAQPSCWVSSRFLSSDYVAQTSRGFSASSRSYDSFRSSALRASRRQSTSDLYAFGTSSVKKVKRKSARSRTRSSKRRSTGSGLYGGSGCPCSGGTVCIGPRGGRYCITSGGNKRYGV